MTMLMQASAHTQVIDVDSKQLSEAGRTREFRDMLFEKIKGKAEKTTTICFVLGSHTVSFIDAFEQLIISKSPKVILVEEENGESFQKMLKGASVKDYMKSRTYISDEFKERRSKFYYFLREQSKNGVIVESLGHFTPFETSVRRIISSHEIDTHAERGNFEKSVKSSNESAKIEATSREAENKDADILTKKTKDKEWTGFILVERGLVHTRERTLVEKKLRDEKVEDVKVISVYPARQVAAEVFGAHTIHKYTPFDELERLYIFGEDKKISKKEFEERENLLGARRVLLEKIKRIPKDENFQVEKAIYEATKLVDQLSYDECREIFKKIRSMDEETAFEFVDDYTKKRRVH
jgi:hypothetical protein